MATTYTHRLSDGTTVTVYESRERGVGDPYSAVLGGKNWPKERSGDAQMLAMSRRPDQGGISQFTSGQVGSHLGKKLAWSSVPQIIQEHIIARCLS